MSGQPLLSVAEKITAREITFEFGGDVLTQCTQSGCFVGQFGFSERGCNTKPNNARDIFRRGAQAFLLSPAEDDWSQAGAFANVQRSDALRPMQFVSGQREQIN